MSNIDLAEYKKNLRLDPHAPNTGDWWARSPVEHDGKNYAPGVKLPQLSNVQVADLLDVNALVSVDPNPQVQQQAPPESQPAPVTPPAAPSGDQQQPANPAVQDPAGQPPAPAAPSGTTRLDENGNPVEE